MTVQSNGLVNVTGTMDVRLPMTNYGTVRVSGSGQVGLVKGSSGSYDGRIMNQAGGLFDIRNNNTLTAAYGNELFSNAGTFRKSVKQFENRLASYGVKPAVTVPYSRPAKTRP